MRTGTLTDGEPWSNMTVYYWHPALKEVRLLSVGSVWRGVGEGRAKFDADSAETELTLHQVGGPRDRPSGQRDLRERWTFAGPDKYHDELSEKVRGDYEMLAAWDRVRVDAAPTAEPVMAPFLAPGGTLSELMRPLEKVLGQAWASIAAAGADAPRPADELRTRTKFEYVPHADAIYGRVEAIGAGGSPSHAMDVYLYHHTGTQTLRCLVLAGQGPNDASVYEGDIVPAGNGGSFTIRLTEHRAAGQQVLEARVEFEQGDTTRVQVWRLHGPHRAMVIDRRHSRGRQ
ncbi:MAG: hypothetical protein ACKVW3_10875 [Phycisphaerales bacterium]